MDLARLLWGNSRVTRFICASGKFEEADIEKRLKKELENDEKYKVQYWPVFALSTGELAGCCGLRPYGEESSEGGEKCYEIGVHLRPEFWGQGYGKEAAEAVIRLGFGELGAKRLFAGHNPDNIQSRFLLKKLGFAYIGDEFYEPTGLYHPSYELAEQSIYS